MRMSIKVRHDSTLWLYVCRTFKTVLMFVVLQSAHLDNHLESVMAEYILVKTLFQICIFIIKVLVSLGNTETDEDSLRDKHFASSRLGRVMFTELDPLQK